MLSDHERNTLREVQRQFMAEDPQFARSFEARQARLSRPSHQLGASLALAAVAVLAVFLLLAGSLAGAVAVAAVTGLIIWVRHQSAGTNRQAP